MRTEMIMELLCQLIGHEDVQTLDHRVHLHGEDCLFQAGYTLTARQYARIVKAWVTAIGLDPPYTAPTRCGDPRRR